MKTTNDAPLVSVWMVTYNHEKYIRQCLESVMMQRTNFKFEVIIGEDCSTDGTRAILQEFEQLYPDVIKPIYHDKNVGAYRNAYEFCYPRLNGKYIACLEADDFWTDSAKLQIQVNALEADTQAVMCFTRVKLLLQGEKKVQEHWSTSYNKLKSRYTLADVLNKFNLVTCSILFRNVYSGQLPYHPADYPTGDVSLSIFLLLKGDAIYLDRLTAVYRLHETGSYSARDLEYKNLVFVKIFEQFLKEPLLASHLKTLKRRLSDRAYQAFCFEIKKPAPDRGKMAEYYSKSLHSINTANIFFPVKIVLRSALYSLTGQSFGRRLN
jgi:glycosyltransferase involved in cell wall biosynthesis